MGNIDNDVNIEVGYTFFMMPFYFDDVNKVTPQGKDSLWEDCSMTIDKGKIYNHIQKFIQSSSDGKGAFKFYSLKEDGEGKVIRKMLNIPMTILNRKQEKHAVSFKFCVDKNRDDKAKTSFFSPKLIICASARVGVLVLPICIDKSIQAVTIQQLCDLNYSLFKTYKKDSTQNAHIYSQRQANVLSNMDAEVKKQIKEKKKSISDWEEKRKKAQQDIKEAKKDKKRTGAKRTLEVSEGQLKRLYEELQEILNKDTENPDTCIFKEIKTIDESLEPVERQCADKSDLLHYWTMRELVKRLMHEFNQDDYTRFNPYRMHPFTYLQIVNPYRSHSLTLLQKTQDLFSSKVFDDFIRIINVHNRKYQVLREKSRIQFEQTFRNIYMGSSTEGGGIMTVLPKDEITEKNSEVGSNIDVDPNKHIKDFHKSSLSQGYFWIYLIVFMQRCTLLGVEKELSEFDFDENLQNGKDNTPQKREKLRNLIKRMTENEINAFFVDISDHTHHNKFYRLCSRNLQIQEHFNDVQRKTRTLKEYLSQLMDQRNEEIVARSEKITRIITIAGIVFALFSGLNDVFDLFVVEKLSLKEHLTDIPLITPRLMSILIVILVIILTWLLTNIYLHSHNNRNK